MGTVLIADDEEMFRDSTARLLDRAGYDCATTRDAAGLKNLLQQREFDLIVADILMPGNADLELVAELAVQDQAPPVLLVTGHPSIGTAAKAVRLRVAGYLTKPVDPALLIETVRREIDAHQSRCLIRKRRGKLELVLADLHELETTLAERRNTSAKETLNVYLAILSDHIVSAIQDLRALVDVIVSREGDEDSRRRLDGTRPYVLLDALREAVAVLEQTKKSFKSKELADLRIKLQALVQRVE